MTAHEGCSRYPQCPNRGAFHLGDILWKHNPGLSYPTRMKLADYLHRNRMTPNDLRRLLGVRRRSTVGRYLTGERIPELRTLQRIIEITGGQVQPVDFLDPKPSQCAVKVRFGDGTPRLVFPWANRAVELDATLTSAFDQSEEDDLPNLAVRKALAVLGTRAVT